MYSPVTNQDITTVNIGAEDLTVSVKETATNFNATKPKNTVRNLREKDISDLESGKTLSCGRRCEHALDIIIHVVPRKLLILKKGFINYW